MRADQIIDVLKRELKRQGLNYKQLADGIGLSEAGIKRMFAQGNFSIQRLEEICGFLGLDHGELFQRLALNSSTEPVTLTWEQEEALATDEDLAIVFHFIAIGKSAKHIYKECGYDETDLFRQLVKLDRLNIIELKENNKFRLKISRSPKWLRGGPLVKKYGVPARQQFIDYKFNGETELEDFCTGPLSRESYKQLARRLKEVFAEFERASLLDRKLVDVDLTTFWFYGGIRPWDPIGVIRRISQRSKTRRLHL